MKNSSLQIPKDKNVPKKPFSQQPIETQIPIDLQINKENFTITVEKTANKKEKLKNNSKQRIKNKEKKKYIRLN